MSARNCKESGVDYRWLAESMGVWGCGSCFGPAFVGGRGDESASSHRAHTSTLKMLQERRKARSRGGTKIDNQDAATLGWLWVRGEVYDSVKSVLISRVRVVRIEPGEKPFPQGRADPLRFLIYVKR